MVLLAALLLAAVGALGAAGRLRASDAEWTATERALIGSLSLTKLGDPPRDPSNRHDTSAVAAALGRALFEDTRLSRTGRVACATCHIASRQFQDDRAVGLGEGIGLRRTMTTVGSAYTPWLFWDGRADSRWAQALGPLENRDEHHMTRTGVVRRVLTDHESLYRKAFGPLPSLAHLPAQAGPLGTPEEQQRWMAMTPTDQHLVNTHFANVGKSLAAFMRDHRYTPGRFDRYADAVAAGREPPADGMLTRQERDGLRLFIGKGQCVTCHAGPRLTDDAFHNTGVPPARAATLDRGRAAALAQLRADPFNCLGRYSDADHTDRTHCRELRYLDDDTVHTLRAFRVPSLRAVAQRAPYMHAGQLATLDDVLHHYRTAPRAPLGTSELRPLRLSQREHDALIALLRTF